MTQREGEAMTARDLHFGPSPMKPEYPEECWEKVSDYYSLMDHLPHAEAIWHGDRYRNDEHGRLWKRAWHA
jgi:hypothetical protein